MRKLLLILILIFWLFPNLLLGQDFIIDVQHYGIQENLSHRHVFFALQDRRGLVWLGTNYGLNRFDGYNFKWITQEKHGLKQNIVKHALEDKDGFLWLFYDHPMPFSAEIVVVKDLDIFDPVSEKVIPFEIFFEGNSILDPTDIIHYCKKESGELVFLTQSNELVIYEEMGKFSTVPLQQTYPSILGFHWSSNGHFWMRVTRENAMEWESFVVAVNGEGKEIFNFPVRNRAREEVFFYQTKGNTNEKWISVNTEFPNDGFQFYEATLDGALIQNSDASLYAQFDLDFIHFDKIARMADEGDWSCFFS